MKTIGVLALQGAFSKHIEKIESLGASNSLGVKAKAKEVRSAKELEQCDALIIPGGESTTLNFLIEKENLYNPIMEFAKNQPVFGTCAGLILMAQFKLLDIEVERNAYGRQVNSFQELVDADFKLKHNTPL